MVAVNKAPTVAKWLLTLTLVAMVLIMASYAMQAFSTVGPKGERGILLPFSALGSSGLSLQHDTLGSGEAIEVDGLMLFTAPSTSPLVIGYYLGILIAFVPGLVLVVLLRKIMTSVSQGEPFSAANIGRIRAIGIITIANEFVRGLVVLLIQGWLADSAKTGMFMTVDVEWNLMIFVLGAVIVALAEVFRYGMQLQADVDLTV